MIEVNKAALMVSVAAVCFLQFMIGDLLGYKKGFERGMEVGWSMHDKYREMASSLYEFMREEEDDG